MARILVVDDDVGTLDGMVELLLGGGHAVEGAATFEEAKRLLALGPPDLLIADVRLGAYNGLHLVLRARIDRPDMPAIITSGFTDHVLEAEARRHGATFLNKPIDPDQLTSIVEEKLSIQPLATVQRRRWPRKHVIGGFLAEVGDAPATILDMSYGGVRFEIRSGADEALPSSLLVTVPAFGLSVTAQPIWTSRAGGTGPLWCGAALAEAESQSSRAWRGLVDALAGSDPSAL